MGWEWWNWRNVTVLTFDATRLVVTWVVLLVAEPCENDVIPACQRCLNNVQMVLTA